MSLFQSFAWNPLEHSDEENLRWSWLRAVEWGIWPAFLSGPVVPLFLPFCEWWKAIGVVAILTVTWSFMRYKYISLVLARFGVYFVQLKWIACPIVAIYLAIQHNFILAILSLLWPMFASFLGIFVGGTQIGRIQKMFMHELGYSERIQLFAWVVFPSIAASLARSVLFFIVTNFGVWISSQVTYPFTLSGLIECYVAAIPFFRNTLAGDLVYVGAMFGIYEFAKKYIPALKLQPTV